MTSAERRSRHILLGISVLAVAMANPVARLASEESDIQLMILIGMFLSGVFISITTAILWPKKSDWTEGVAVIMCLSMLFWPW